MPARRRLAMSEALRRDPSSRLWEAVPDAPKSAVATKPLRPRVGMERMRRTPAPEASYRYWAPTAIAPTELPTPEPGQLWYVRLASAEHALSPLEYRALTAANV